MVAITEEALRAAVTLAVRATSTTTASSSATATSTATAGKPPIYKVIGIILAVSSGLFIGTSFVLKKVGLLKANAKYHEEAGEGYGYLKNVWWWSGMTLMIIGEICNFVAYAFTDAILVTPLGALSVVITTILSAIFLKERLSFVGQIACFMCIVGAIIIPLNAPTTGSVSNIQEMQHYVLQPGFLVYAGVVIIGSIFTALWVGPRYGKKSMMVYLSICSMVGGLSVVSTQGLGSAILAQARGEAQFNKWFIYVLLVFVIGTLLTEIIYLNVSLDLMSYMGLTPLTPPRKRSTSSTPPWSRPHTTSSSPAPLLSPRPFCSKGSTGPLLRLSTLCSASSSSAQVWCSSSSPSRPRTSQIQPCLPATSTRSGPWQSRKSPSTSPAPIPFVAAQALSAP